MTPERFHRVEELAMLVLEQDEPQRAAFLDNACSGDSELRKEVESLLAADENAQAFLSAPAAAVISGGRSDDTPALPPGTMVGRYRVERELGSGGMGLVYAAYDPELDRRVAVKLVRPAASGKSDPAQSRSRLLREAQAMAQLTHPNVLAIHDVGTFGDEVFIAMEYAEGSTLSDWLSARPRSWREIVAMFAQAGRGLLAAHAKSIVHRDFKADNVWVGEDGRARVFDFGLARAMKAADEGADTPDADGDSPPRLLSSPVTQPGVFLGTPPYTPPERLKGGSADARGDQFSFCVALYYALYGALPFSGGTLPALLDQMERSRISEPPKSRGIPSSLRRVLLRGLNADPARRFDSMEQLLDQLAKQSRPARRHLLAIPIAVALAAAGVVLARPGSVNVSSIAVLPLKNLSGDPQQDYFADGMTEALTTELGKIAALQVLSHQSTARYRQTALPLSLIARELRVDTFLEGAVLQSGAKVRITAKLIQASPERQLWAENYEFDRRDVLAIQGEVARAVASRIRVKVSAPEVLRLTNERRVDSEAYEAYLLGRAESARTPTPASWTRAKEYFETAIAKDPGYAPAYAGLAELQIVHRAWVKSHSEARRQAHRWAEEAVRLDDNLADAHVVLARCAQQDWDWAATEREFRRALELNPSHALARTWYAMYLFAMRRFDEALVEATRAQQLDPVSSVVHTWAGYTLFLAGRGEEGAATLRKVLDRDPTHSDASLALARVYVTQGKPQDAVVELQKALIFNPRQPLLIGALAQAHARAGQRDEALRLLADLKRIEADAPGYGPFGMIWAYEAIGDKEAAFAYLEKAYESRAGRLAWLDVDPTLGSLRSDPRFADLLRRIGLAPSRAAP